MGCAEKSPPSGPRSKQERNRFEMRLLPEDEKRLNQLSHREQERDRSKIVRAALHHYEKSPPERKPR